MKRSLRPDGCPGAVVSFVHKMTEAALSESFAAFILGLLVLVMPQDYRCVIRPLIP